jgi:hypothetical protein
MTGRRAALSLPQRCWGRWRAAPDGVWKATPRQRAIGATGVAIRGAELDAGRQNGRAATFPSILTEVCSGATSEHDESGNDALARGTQSSDRGARLSQANADWALFRGFRLPCAENRRRSGRPHARDGGSQDQGRRKGRMVSTGGISRSSLSRRAYHWRSSDRHRAHQSSHPGSVNRQERKSGPCTETSQAAHKAFDDIHASGLSFEERATPHPSLRASFPSRAGEGERPILRGCR